jgi:micrococcal nuclease
MKNSIVILFWLLFSPVVQNSQVFTGKCIGVIDGDTVEVLHDGQAERIRLDGVDCPESGQDFGTRAKQFISELAFGKVVTVIEKEKDKYGRTVARILVAGQDLSVQLVAAGLAWHYKEYSDDFVLAKLEIKAREDMVGLWSIPNPIPPWNYRRGEIKNPSEVNAPASKGLVYHGNVRSKIFHKPSCRYYNCKNCTREFTSREEAVAAGFRPCGICKP